MVEIGGEEEVEDDDFETSSELNKNWVGLSLWIWEWSKGSFFKLGTTWLVDNVAVESRVWAIIIPNISELKKIICFSNI